MTTNTKENIKGIKAIQEWLIQWEKDIKKSDSLGIKCYFMPVIK